MYGGQVMEECRATELAQARHPYTRGLLDCLPQLDGGKRELAVLQRDPAWLESTGKPA
jgi:peptide/nickel transport system ATP-binding protein